MTRTSLLMVAPAAFLVGAYVGSFFTNQETRHFCAVLASHP
jgi:hypothetical protein